ncbi:MAG: helix-hairpin-helix domain-containing protein [Polyangiaceae bacterium]
MTWVEANAPDPSDAQPDLPRGGRWSAPAPAHTSNLVPLLVRGAVVLIGVLTLAGVGAAASAAHLPTAAALLDGGLGLQAQMGSAWLAPSPEASERKETEPTTVQTPTPNPAESLAPHPSHEGGNSPALTADGKVILNQADENDLQRLPGVGRKRAEAILALRQRLGRFKRMHQLLRVKGIGPRALRRIREQAVLDAPKEE